MLINKLLEQYQTWGKLYCGLGTQQRIPNLQRGHSSPLHSDMKDSKGEHEQAKKLSFKAVLSKTESFSELSWQYSWLHYFCSLDDLRPPGPCQALLDPPDFWKQLQFSSLA